MYFQPTFKLHHALATPSASLLTSSVHPEILWDMRFSPQHSILKATQTTIPDHVLRAYATTPPVAFLRITSGLFGSHTWNVDVHNSRGVTVRDVLAELYKSLRKRVEWAEWNGRGHSQQVYMADAFHKRIKLSADPTRERSKGVRRIDWMLQNTVFVGLQRSYEDPFTWTLVTKRNGR
ncbi:hypothetical protein SCHPADRAFT_830737 [Schizopora paradoxa]|uniref:DUF6699 domain-containing protein n=1 Tax=Schizopora paradoxa TaxID=27342 RepID=A0A0H2RQA2_9AGAM|nr:hypothetical protein SCHPADRAFT_830737 [Schizopora paradoxa]